MRLPPGTALGPYQLESLIGAGGWAVYRAQDARLNRTVAIKVLSPEVATPDRLHRFEQEARAASALNHPNILTIYDVGREGATAYFAMEWVDGQTLRDLLTAGRIPVRPTMAQSLAATIEADPTPVETLNPEIPLQLATIVGRRLAKDPAERYESTRDLARDLKGQLDTSSRTSPVVLPARRRVRPRHLAVAAIALVLSAASAAWIWRPTGRTPVEEGRPLVGGLLKAGTVA